MKLGWENIKLLRQYFSTHNKSVFYCIIYNEIYLARCLKYNFIRATKIFSWLIPQKIMNLSGFFIKFVKATCNFITLFWISQNFHLFLCSICFDINVFMRNEIYKKKSGKLYHFSMFGCNCKNKLKNLNFYSPISYGVR